MKRRTFFRSTLAAAGFAALPRTRSLHGWAGFREVSQDPPDLRGVTGDGREITISGTDVAELAARMRGPVLLPGDDGYDTSRLLLNPSFDMHPALVALPSGAADVSAAVEFAKSYDLLTAVKCGGHSSSGKSSCDHGLQIDLSRFQNVRVDPEGRRAWATGGTLLGLVDHETMSHGLVTTMGTVSHTGAGGLVTGGGFGRLGRRFGLAIDNLLSVDVVTADGELRHASVERNPDLFWGVRGGGGNFGVVTNFEFRLHPMQREVVSGQVVFPFERARDVLSMFADYAPTAPNELDFGFFVGDSPGQPMACGIYVCYSGPAERAESAFRPIRQLGTPMMDQITTMDYVAVQRAGDIDDPRAQASYLKSGFISEMPGGLIDAILDGIEADPGRRTGVFFQQSGGLINEVATSATAFPTRGALGNLLSSVNWPSDRDPAEHVDWIKDFWSGIEPFTRGFYTNDIEIDQTAADVNATFGPNHARLVEVKNRYDPTNLFRLNANVQPSV